MMLKGLISVSMAVAYTLAFVLLAGAAPAGPLAQVIEGAKKEGTVSAKLLTNFTPNSMYRLEKEIKSKFGVDLKIEFIPAIDMQKVAVEAIMEQNAGAVPSSDVATLSSDLARAMKSGAFEKVDWKPLLIEGMNPNVVLDTPLVYGGIVHYTGHVGLMYSPEKVKADEVPKKLADLANPKWKGKGGVQNLTNFYARWCLILGKEKVLFDLRAILKNGAIQGGYPDLLNRFLIGEISWCTIGSAFLKDPRDKGVPAEWQTLDFADISEFALVLRKGARHPNAAKLLSLYLASPDGAKFTLEEGKAGNLYYPGNYEHDIRMQNQKQGIPEIFNIRKTEILEFYNSEEAGRLQKEIQLILQTGGR